MLRMKRRCCLVGWGLLREPDQWRLWAPTWPEHMTPFSPSQRGPVRSLQGSRRSGCLMVWDPLRPTEAHWGEWKPPTDPRYASWGRACSLTAATLTMERESHGGRACVGPVGGTYRETDFNSSSVEQELSIMYLTEKNSQLLRTFK